MRYQENYTPKEAAVNIALEAVLRALMDMRDAFPKDTPTYRARVRRQLERLAVSFGDKYHFDFVLPDPQP